MSTETDLSHTQKRWYDQEPSCVRLLTQIHAMEQPEVREFCGQVIVHFCEKLRKELQAKDRKVRGVKSIGLSAISGLYRFGQQKRRWYDQHVLLHRAVGMLYTLSNEGMALVGFKLGDTFGLIQVYSRVCSELAQEPSLTEMAKICKTSFQAGPREAKDILVAIVGEELYESLRPQSRHS